MTCTFFGHSDADIKIIPALQAAIIDLIENKKVNNFYVDRVEQIIRTRLKAAYFGAFYPIHSCKALALLRLTQIKIPQNLLALRSLILKRADFCEAEAQNAVNPDGLTSILTKDARKSAFLKRRSDYLLYPNHGHFDFYVKNILGELAVIYPHIKYSVVLAYLPRESEKEYGDFSNTIYPEGLENTPLKFAIVKRNRWMIEKSDFVITHVKRVIGGAAQFKELAKKKGKTVINV